MAHSVGHGIVPAECFAHGPNGNRIAWSPTDIMHRDNETWLMHLRADGADQLAALSDLRQDLLRGLRRALAHGAPADEALLEDAVQSSLVLILDRLQQFEGRSRFLTWATSIAIRVAMSELRRQRWQDVSLDAVIADADFTPEPADANDSGPGTQWAQKAILDKMHEVIQKELTDKQRTVLHAELKEIPLDEIARYIGSNRNAVYKLTHDARKRLKRGLEAAGYEAADIRVAFAD